MSECYRHQCRSFLKQEETNCGQYVDTEDCDIFMSEDEYNVKALITERDNLKKQLAVKDKVIKLIIQHSADMEEEYICFDENDCHGRIEPAKNCLECFELHFTKQAEQAIEGDDND